MPFLLVDGYNGNDDEIFPDFTSMTDALADRFDADDLIRGLRGSIRIYEIVREVELEVETRVIIKDAREDDEIVTPNSKAQPYIPFEYP